MEDIPKVTQPECKISMERVHTRVDGVEKTTAQIEVSAKNIEKNVCDMRNLMYGSEKGDGLITKVSIQGQKLGGLYWFGGVVIIALVGTLIGLIFRGK